VVSNIYKVVVWEWVGAECKVGLNAEDAEGAELRRGKKLEGEKINKHCFINWVRNYFLWEVTIITIKLFKELT